jgi:hypothetical protein
MTDLRKATDRDTEMLSRVERDGGFSVAYLTANRDHAASIHRLIASGQIRIAGDGWVSVRERSAWDGLREFLRLCRTWLVGGKSV